MQATSGILRAVYLTKDAPEYFESYMFIARLLAIFQPNFDTALARWSVRNLSHY